MWIRSQDKTILIKADYVKIGINEIVAACSNKPCVTIGEVTLINKKIDEFGVNDTIDKLKYDVI